MYEREKENMNKVTFTNWELVVKMMPFNGDYVTPYGLMLGHPTLNGQYAHPGTFVSFNRETREGISRSGNVYWFEPDSFRPNGNSQTEKDAFDWIEKNWVIKGED